MAGRLKEKKISETGNKDHTLWFTAFGETQLKAKKELLAGLISLEGEGTSRTALGSSGCHTVRTATFRAL